MKRFEEKFKKEFLNELNTPDMIEQIKEKTGIKSTHKEVVKKHNGFVTWFLGHKKVLIPVLSVFIIAVVATISTFEIIRFSNIPVYKGLEASALNANEKKLTSTHTRHKDLMLIGDIIYLDDKEDETVPPVEPQTGVEEEIQHDIKPIIPEGIAFYGKKGETIQITVKIDNPKFFEILSFTLNGRLYQTYEFKEGSNSEQIIVDFTCQDESGLQKVTIDAIKYVEGTKIRDARFDADRTITLGIKYEEVPTVSNLTEIIETTYFGLSFVITDVNNLADINDGLKMYIFDGEKIINVSALRHGTNVFPFSNLHMGETYEYAIVGVYDQLDGRGKCANVLHKNKFTTKEGIEVNNLDIKYDSIMVDFNQIHKEELTITDIKLIDKDNVINGVLNEGKYSFNNLLSSHDYILETTYKYQIVENEKITEVSKTIRKQVRTATRPVPTIDFKDIVIEKESVSFNFDIKDTAKDFGKILKVELLHNGKVLKELPAATLRVTNLYSNYNYTLRVTYEYDLLDGTEKKTITNEYDFKTLEKTAPKVTLTSGVFFDNLLTVWFKVSDPEKVLTIKKFEVYDESGNLVAEKETSDHYSNATLEGDISFSGLTNTGNYKIVVVYEYDLNDSLGVIVINKDSINKDNTLVVTK